MLEFEQQQLTCQVSAYCWTSDWEMNSCLDSCRTHLEQIKGISRAIVNKRREGVLGDCLL